MTQSTANQKPTVQQVAKRAKVSRASVYAVLNADRATNIRVSQAKAEQILKAANELGYVRNELARSLSTGKTYTIGVSVVTLKAHFYSDFFTNLDDACYSNNYSVFVTSSEYDPDRELRNLKAFQAKCVDAVIISRGAPGMNDNLLGQLMKSGVPVIIMGEVDVPNLPYPVVGFNEEKVGVLMAQHLWKLGHRRVLWFSADSTTDGSIRIHQVRRASFTKAWREISAGSQPSCFSTSDSMHGGAELAAYLESLPCDQRPTAVACSTDLLGVSAVSALRFTSLKVPADISVISCDDSDIASAASVPLTTIRLPIDVVAERSWNVLKEYLDGKPLQEPFPRIIIEPKLVVRESTQAVGL